MKITKRKLRRIIAEERSLLKEQRKFELMLIQEGKFDAGLKMAFAAIKKTGEAAKWIAQFLKANPEVGDAVLAVLAPDEKK